MEINTILDAVQDMVEMMAMTMGLTNIFVNAQSMDVPGQDNLLGVHWTCSAAPVEAKDKQFETQGSVAFYKDKIDMDSIHFITSRSCAVAMGVELRPEIERLYIYKAMKLADVYPYSLTIAAFIDEAMHSVKSQYEKNGIIIEPTTAIEQLVKKLGELVKNVWTGEIYPMIVASMQPEEGKDGRPGLLS